MRHTDFLAAFARAAPDATAGGDRLTMPCSTATAATPNDTTVPSARSAVTGTSTPHRHGHQGHHGHHEHQGHHGDHEHHAHIAPACQRRRLDAGRPLAVGGDADDDFGGDGRG